MARQRKALAPALNTQVALAALKGDRTINELAGQHGVHPPLIHSWKKQLLQGAEDFFSGGRKETAADDEALRTQLYEQIGRLQMELAWVKKKSAGLG
jgi:transposase